MFQKIRTYFARRRLHKYMQKNRIKLQGYGGLNIHGQVVSEFSYLLDYLTDGRLDSFRDLEAVSNHQGQVENAAAKELARPELQEQLALRISRAMATRNIETLVKIVNTIAGYVRTCRELNLPLGAGK